MSFFGDLLAGQSAYKAGQYNKALYDYDAKIKEQDAEAGFQIFLQYDLPKFNEMAAKETGAIQATLAARGVELDSGTPMDIFIENTNKLETDRAMMNYNAKVLKQRKNNEAILLRAQGDLEAWKGQVAKTASYFKATGSLLTDSSNFMTAKKLFG